MNSTAVTEQVNMIKNRSSLLLWYTGDESDGTSDPLNATKTAYDLIYDLDGYHPVSLVLNCYVRPPPQRVIQINRLTVYPSPGLRIPLLYIRRRHHNARYLHDRQQRHLLRRVAYTLYPLLWRLRLRRLSRGF